VNRKGKFCNCTPTPNTFTTEGGTWCSICFGEIPKTARELGARYHEHLDECSRCREEPFNPCELGKGLLMDISNKTPGCF